MKKHFIGIIVLLILFIAVSFLAPFADAREGDLAAVVQVLQQQIEELKKRITELQVQSAIPQDAPAHMLESIQLTKTLRRGTTGDEVRKLQEFLSQFPDIYPEGLITAYFGPVTEAAVKKWQERNGLAVVGVVGPQTRARISAFAKERSNKTTDSGTKPQTPVIVAKMQKDEVMIPAPTTTAPAATIPTASEEALIIRPVPAVPFVPSPGEEGTGSRVVLAIPAASVNPATPAQQTATSSSDITAPVISAIMVSETTATSTVIQWKTDKPTTGHVFIASLGNTFISNSTGLFHTAFINGLSPEIAYSALVRVTDHVGKESSASVNFKTLNLACHLQSQTLGCPLIEDAGHQAHPRIYGAHIIYADNNGPGWGLSYLNRSTKEHRVIVESSAGGITMGEYDIDGTTAVYQRGGDIYLYDIATGNSLKILHTEGRNAGDPSISGNYIIWHEYAPGGGGNMIVLYNKASGETKQVTDPGPVGLTGGFLRPFIYGDKIVYEADANGSFADIYLYDIPTGQSIKIGYGNYPQIYGDYVVWSGPGTLNPIILYHISTQTQKTIGSGNVARIYGDTVVWWQKQVAVYKISSGQKTTIFGDGGGFTGPDVYENTLVWGDQRSSPQNLSTHPLTDIYFMVIPENL